MLANALQWLARWYIRRLKSRQFTAPLGSAGVPDGPIPDIDSLWQSWTPENREMAFARLQVIVPRLRSDSEESCPCSRESISKYVGLEEGQPVEGLVFLRTGQILDSCWWLWQYQSPHGEKSYVSVGLMEVPMTGSFGASTSWTTDQVIFYDFLRTLHGLRLELVRAADGTCSLVPKKR